MGVIGVDPDLVRRVGPNAAILHGQLVYWVSKARGGLSRYVVEINGEKWVARTKEQLEEETGLTAKMLRSAVDTLHSQGLLLRLRRRFDGVVINHYRPAHMGTSLEAPICPKGTSQPAHTGTSHLIYETEDKIIGSGTAETHFEESKKMVSKRKEGLTVSDVLAGKKVVADKVVVSPALAEKPAHLIDLFKQAWVDEYPDLFLGSFSIKQHGQFGMLLKKCPEGKAGEVLDYCVRNWSSFVERAVEDQGAIKPPNLPDISTLLRFVQSAVNSYLEGTKEQAAKPLGGFHNPPGYTPTKQPQKHAQKASEGAVQGQDTPTHDEVIKLLGLDE